MSDLMPWHKTWIVDIEYDRVDLVKEGANSQAFIKIAKAKGGTPMDPKLEEIIKALKPEHQEVIRKALEDATSSIIEKANKDAEEIIAKAKKDAEEMTPAAPAASTSEEEILKSVKDPAVKALLETQIAKTRAAEDVAKALKAEQTEKEAIAKAKEVPNLGAEEAELASVYKKLKAADPALCEDVFGIFKAASALVNAGGVFTEVGKSLGNSGEGVDETSAWGKIEAAAEAITKSQNISKAAATRQVIRDNPGLYQAYLDAQNG